MTVQRYILNLPEKQRRIMTILRSWIFDLGTHIQEHLTTDGPSFQLHGALCYLMPEDEDGVILSFNRGYELPKNFDLLESKDHKHVRSITFYGVTELEEHAEEVKKILNEAAALNGFLAKKRSI
jgi:hypothetical protein